MMGAWANVMESINAEPIPVGLPSCPLRHANVKTLIQSYYFARDDRVYKAFVGRLDQHQTAIQQSCSKRLRWQLGILKNRFDGRNISYRVCPTFRLCLRGMSDDTTLQRKIEIVATELQGSPR